MKLLVMGNNGHLGGLSVHYTTLVKYLQQTDFQIMCININDTNDKIFNNESIEEIIIPYKPATIIDKVKKVLKLAGAGRRAKAFAPDVFIATGLGYGYALIASKLPKSTFKIFEEVHFEATADKLRLKMVNDFDAVAVQTKGMIKPFTLNVSTSKPVDFLPCFSKEYEADSYKAIPALDEGIRIAYFGRLAWNKGLKDFIKATAAVFKTNQHITLNIYGGGPEAKSIQQEIDDQGLNSQISLKGFYSDAEFPDLISNHHGVIIPSIATEGLPLALIESMRFGRPVFATTIGAMPEVGETNKEGLFISEIDKDSLHSNFSSFIDMINGNKYSAQYINNIYEENYSNLAFNRTWLKMLSDPKGYFSASKRTVS